MRGGAADHRGVELFDTTQVGLEAALRGAAARQQALAANVANANTPGYRRVDVDFQGALRGAMASGDRVGMDAARFAPSVDATAATRVDGSTVDLDREATEQATNGLTYQTLAAVLKTRTTILQSAMGVS